MPEYKSIGGEWFLKEELKGDQNEEVKKEVKEEIKQDVLKPKKVKKPILKAKKK